VTLGPENDPCLLLSPAGYKMDQLEYHELRRFCPVVNVIKLFTAVIYEFLQLARVFVLGKLFQTIKTNTLT